MDEHRFQVRLGRIRQTKAPQARKLSGHIQRVVQAAGGLYPSSKSSRRFKGINGRGFGAQHRHGFAGQKMRRAMVKTRLVKGNASATRISRAKAVRSHMHYIERESAGRTTENERSAPDRNKNADLSKARELESEAGLYTDPSRKVDKEAFLEKLADDRHYFRIIVSPEDGHELQSLKAYTQDFMKGVEKDLGSALEWVGVNHFNTDHPHAHIIIRGKDDTGQDLIISRDYISHGFRARASDHLSLELGPRSDRDIAASLKRQVDQLRFTSLDRDLKRMALDNEVEISDGQTSYDRFKSGLLKGRLNKLEMMGLSEQVQGHRNSKWRLSPSMKETLISLGEKGDIIRTMQRRMSAARELRIWGKGDGTPDRLLGEVVEVGLSNELADHRYLMIDGIDGRSWYADIGPSEDLALPPKGALVDLTQRAGRTKPSDHTIHEIARATGGHYSADLHVQKRGPQSPQYLNAHKRRLEALRRLGITERRRDGSWEIPHDFLAQVRLKSKTGPELQVRSWLPLEKLVQASGHSSLDGFLEAHDETPSAQGFGARFSDALAKRRNWLRSQNLMAVQGERELLDQKKLDQLMLARLRAEGKRIAASRNLVFKEVRIGGQVTGRIADTIDLPNGRYAVVQSRTHLMLVPWKPVLEKYRGQQVAATLRGTSTGLQVSWQLGKSRNLPSR